MPRHIDESDYHGMDLRGMAAETMRERDTLKARVAELEAGNRAIVATCEALTEDYRLANNARVEAEARVAELEAGIQAVLHDKDGIDHSECTIALDKLAALLDDGRADSVSTPDPATIAMVVKWLDECIAYQAKTAAHDWDRAKLEANEDIRTDLVSGAWRGAQVPAAEEPDRNDPFFLTYQAGHVRGMADAGKTWSPVDADEGWAEYNASCFMRATRKEREPIGPVFPVGTRVMHTGDDGQPLYATVTAVRVMNEHEVRYDNGTFGGYWETRFWERATPTGSEEPKQ